MPRNSPVSGISGSVRIQRLSGVALAAAEAHGKRLDRNGQARAIYENAPPLTTSGLDLRRLHAAHVEGAAKRKGAPEALHMVLQFPTELVNGEDAGAMLTHANLFAQSIFGAEASFADRVDRDEKGRHVVDLFLAPKYQKLTKRGSKLALSTSKHLKELAATRNKAPNLRGQGQALQDAWFEYLRDRMQLHVRRGVAKKLPGEDWQTPEELELERLREMQSGIRAKNQRLAEEGDRIAREAELRAGKARKEAAALQFEVDDLRSEVQRLHRGRESAVEAARRSAEGGAAKIRQEATDGLLRARREAEKIRREATPEKFRALEAENQRLTQALSLWEDFRESMRATLSGILGRHWDEVRQKINAAWAKDPKNPARVPPNPPPDPDPFDTFSP